MKAKRKRREEEEEEEEGNEKREKREREEGGYCRPKARSLSWSQALGPPDLLPSRGPSRGLLAFPSVVHDRERWEVMETEAPPLLRLHSTPLLPDLNNSMRLTKIKIVKRAKRSQEIENGQSVRSWLVSVPKIEGRITLPRPLRERSPASIES